MSAEEPDEMSAEITTSEMLGQFINGRFIPRMAGGEGDPPVGDSPNGDDPPTGKDGKPFDADRAQRLIDQQRDEIKALKATSKELADARARLKEIEDKDKSEVERLAGSAKEASEKLTAAEARAQDLAIRLSVERAARKLNFIDEDDAYRLLDRKAVEMDEGGEPTNVEKLLADLAKAKPHLIQVEGEAQKTGAAATQKVPHARPNGKPPTRDELVAEHQKQQAATGLFSRL
jgi:hypothetical protein